MNMTLENAIKHCLEKANDCTEYGKEHAQLASWLQELKTYRENGILLPCKIGDTYWTFDNMYWLNEEKCVGCKYYYDLVTESFCECDDDYPPCTKVYSGTFKNESAIVSAMKQIGKTIFIGKNGKQEAEKRLAELKSGCDREEFWADKCLKCGKIYQLGKAPIVCECGSLTTLANIETVIAKNTILGLEEVKDGGINE